MKEAAAVVNSMGPEVSFGCVAIAERHTKKNNEQYNMMRKQNYGAKYFITQGIFDATAIVRLIKDYGALCRELDVEPRKIILTFAPCGREKTLRFIKWLGMKVPEQVSFQFSVFEPFPLHSLHSLHSLSSLSLSYR